MQHAGPSQRRAATAAIATRLIQRAAVPSRGRLSLSSPTTTPPRHALVRHLSTPSNRIAKERYNFNTSLNFSAEPDPDHVNYRRVTASELASRREPPRRVKMLVRDFIDDSLYNPHYGYFSRNATIFTPPAEGFDFSAFADAAAFQEAVASRYEEFEAKEVALERSSATPTGTKKAQGSEGAESDPRVKFESAGVGETGAEPRGKGGLGRQVWHTPTELFKPHYARALTSALLTSYKLNHFPSQPLLIYEIGAGNGSFMLDCLSFLRSDHPEVFARTKFRIVEISPQLADIQRRRAEEAGFADRVEVINEDVFQWEGGSGDGCFVVALEVFDNFAHDMIRYDLSTMNPLQAVVSIDASGDFTLLYEALTDPLLRRVLAYRRLLPPSPSTRPSLSPMLNSSSLLRRMYTSLPFAPNLSAPDFIPTKAVLFLERLRERLPGHRLLMADFDALPDAVEGRNGPVVQTRYGGSMVPCETFLVKQGYFDIFFPTDFNLLRDIYSLIMNSPSSSFSTRKAFDASETSPVAQTATQKRQSSHPGAHAVSSSKPLAMPTAKKAFPQSSASGSVSSSSHSPRDPPFLTISSWSPASPPASSLPSTFFSSLSSTGVRGFRRRQVSIHPHADFLELYGGKACVGATRTRDGGSVMLGMYKNAKVMF